MYYLTKNIPFKVYIFLNNNIAKVEPNKVKVFYFLIKVA
jgi:hypothetical protein